MHNSTVKAALALLSHSWQTDVFRSCCFNVDCGSHTLYECRFSVQGGWRAWPRYSLIRDVISYHCQRNVLIPSNK